RTTIDTRASIDTQERWNRNLGCGQQTQRIPEIIQPSRLFAEPAGDRDIALAVRSKTGTGRTTGNHRFFWSPARASHVLQKAA
ncbi:MAG: hypothetical protein KDA91_12465, partial [Planctomycetaceae bacterium]|nr:hypothetical protein [Planctomycetaceae bacterium]